MTEKFTNEEKADCAERELRWRRRVYPRRIDKGSMTKVQAEREIAMMTEIAADYRAKGELPL
jgi:hypothetical protein